MQLCYRQSRCITCCFRQSLKAHSWISQIRQYHASLEHGFPNRSTQSERGRKPPKKTNQRFRGKSLKFHDAHTTSTGKGDACFNEIEQKRFVEKVHKVLAAISNSLEKDPSDDGSAKQDYFTGLVTDKDHWKEFEDTIRKAVENHAQSELVREIQSQTSWGVLDRLKRHSTSLDWFQHMARTIKFAYIDEMMQANTTKEGFQNTDMVDLRYPTEWYHKARCVQRHIHLHVGPTNSGKTYNALKRLEESKDGFYAGPLRLLAHEVYSRFNDRGIQCELITGDDVRLSEDKVDMYCSTVEMVDINRTCSVGVIDEIQLIGSADRGWAWTRALLGSKAKELHLCGEARAVPLVRELVASMGDTLHIHQYDRLNPLKVMSQSLKGNLKSLRKGDCVVSFSVMNIHALKKQIERETGRRVAIVYGSLPPETRAQQAALFNDPDNDYDFLVASDAVGMGLNLSIKRMIFERTMRYNGAFHERLSVPQIKQIAGRAGRYRTASDDKTRVDMQKPNSKPPTNVGLVTCLDDRDLPIIASAMKTEAPPIKAAGLLPPGEIYERATLAWPKGLPFEYIMTRLHQIVSLNSRFTLCEISDQLSLARAIEGVENLSVAERLQICASPATIRSRSGEDSKVIVAFAKIIASKQTVTVCDIPEIPLEILDQPMSPDREYLEGLEILHKTLNLYLWLHYRFVSLLDGREIAQRAKALTEEKINACLEYYSANPNLAERLKKIQEASALLRKETGQSAVLAEETVTMNPDASVEEIERQARQEAEQQEKRDHEIQDFVNDRSAGSDLPPADHPLLNYEWDKKPVQDEPIVVSHEQQKQREGSATTG